jgi:hypothetical protein
MMTFRELLSQLSQFATDNPDHVALDQGVLVRFRTSDEDGDDLLMGDLREVAVDAGCTETHVLMLDVEQDPEED